MYSQESVLGKMDYKYHASSSHKWQIKSNVKREACITNHESQAPSLLPPFDFVLPRLRRRQQAAAARATVSPAITTYHSPLTTRDSPPHHTRFSSSRFHSTMRAPSPPTSCHAMPLPKRACTTLTKIRSTCQFVSVGFCTQTSQFPFPFASPSSSSSSILSLSLTHTPGPPRVSVRT